MIGRLRGRLLEKEPSGLVVEAGGVGYSVAVPLSTFSRLDTETVDLYIHTEVRADAILLFGFLLRRFLQRGMRTIYFIQINLAFYRQSHLWRKARHHLGFLGNQIHVVKSDAALNHLH